MVLSSDLEIIFDPTKDNINGLRKVARMLVDEANEDKKALLEAKNDLIASNGKEIQLRAEISELEKNIVSAYRKLHATTQRDVIECVESFHMTMTTGGRLDKWKHYLINEPTGIAILTCVEKSIPQWTQGSSQSQKADYFAKKIVNLYSMGCDPAHGTSVELNDKTANATMASSDVHYSVQAMNAIQCICNTLGIGFAVIP
eukprot:CAMPEP_0170060122 /NCGR_PEP_ID=MMETSP0019_2-20121128/2163_1 /TAXON_ID=98059 /ORGANISM="Dinobryon sp., Strain UTEXLB2267" /LENGTH=200 /DNA_ID=CAMNT_0010265583 /DNA_START=168 /DNA_END=770 /DNA_ORIENTATION=-